MRSLSFAVGIRDRGRSRAASTDGLRPTQLRQAMKTGHLLIALAALNAILYSMLLPLWEGFDEPFHFGYVQGLANQQGFPDARSARLSREVRDSILLAPASQSVKNNLPQVTTYSQFFSWSPERRAAARRALYNIPRDYRWQSSDFLNYEAQHAPLEYALLAIPERILAGLPLPSRVLLLRILTALSCSFLLYAGASALCIEVGVRENHRNIALFSVFSSQMTWATLAHITNDSLAVPLTVWLLVFLIRCTSRMDARNVAITAVVLSAALLTKAYFVALAPLLFGICLIRRDWRRFMMAALIVAVCAGPWYARNYRLYGVVMGTQDARGGIGPRAVLTRAPQMNWPKVAVDSVREALWTGNNSFRTFSLGTINTAIALCVVAFLLWLFTRHARPEWLVAAYCAVFGAALAYNGVAAEIMTRGASSTPAPWYSQVMVTPLLVLAALGTGRWRIGPLVAAAQALVFGYVLGATYVVKLIPLYAGYGGRGTARDIAVLYRNFSALSERLGSVALGQAPLIFGLTAAVLLLIVAVEILLLHGLFGGRRDVPAVAINA